MNTSYARQSFGGPWHRVEHAGRRITGQAVCGVIRVFLAIDDAYTAWADTRVTIPAPEQPRCPECFARAAAITPLTVPEREFRSAFHAWYGAVLRDETNRAELARQAMAAQDAWLNAGGEMTEWARTLRAQMQSDAR